MTKIENIYDHPNYYSLDDFLGEVWRQIPGLNSKYFASSLGRVKTIGAASAGVGKGYYERPSRIIGAHLSNNYYACAFDRRSIHIHKVVASAFLEAKPSSAHQVNHKDGRKWNNRYENLEWVTPSENMQHAINTGLRKYARGILGSLSVQIAQYSKEGSLIAVYGSAREAGNILKMANTNIISAANGKYKTAYGFVWKKITKDEYFILKKKLEEESERVLSL